MKFRPPVKLKGKTYKRLYSGSRRFDSSCRNHGGCGWCKGNRTFFDRRARTHAELEIKEYEQGR